MTSISNPLDVPLAEAKLLNARRYGVTQDDLSQFAELMKTVTDKKPDVPDGETTDVSEISTADLIKDYIKQRMTARMSASLADGRYPDAFSPDGVTNPQDFILDMMSAPRQHSKSNDVSGLLNMHFDLNTLQMLS